MEAANAIDWIKPQFCAQQLSGASFEWFTDAEVNTCNALDRHVESGRADQTAIIYDSPVTGTIQLFLSNSLEQTAKLAASGASGITMMGHHLYADDTSDYCCHASLRAH